MKRASAATAFVAEHAQAQGISTARPETARLSVTVTVAELAELVRSAALEAAAEITERPPSLLDRAGLARELGVGTTTVDRLRADGLPAIWIGDSPRFEFAECLAWLRASRQP